MKRLKKGMHQFLVDANVFIAAIKNPDKKTRILNVVKNKEMFHGKQGFIYITCKKRDD